MRLLPIVLGLAICTAAIAGDKGNIMGPKGSFSNAPSGYNAGDSIVCRDKGDFHIKNAFLLEYAELDSLKSSVIKFDNSYTDLQYITSLATILEREAPDLFVGFRQAGSRIASQASYFMDNRQMGDLGVNFQSNQPYLEANFAKVSKAPKNMAKDCQIEPLVMTQRTYRGIQFIIQADIYVKLSQRDRRGMILHEALFQSIQRYYGDQDSARTRYIHQRLVQFELSELTTPVIQDILSRSYLDFQR